MRMESQKREPIFQHSFLCTGLILHVQVSMRDSKADREEVNSTWGGGMDNAGKVEFRNRR